jgi:hypothetical protein
MVTESFKEVVEWINNYWVDILVSVLDRVQHRAAAWHSIHY